MSNAEHCVCCGAVIPEGRQVCVICGYKAENKADLVNVVRCKDCKHFKPLSDDTWINQNREDGICYALVNYHDSERYCVQPDHYCSYGERKEK